MISYRQSDDTLIKTPAPPILSERHAADYIGLSVDLLRYQVNSGALKPLGNRRNRKFLQADLDRWKAKHKAPKKGRTR